MEARSTPKIILRMNKAFYPCPMNECRREKHNEKVIFFLEWRINHFTD
jgi:hypothetical protein